MKLYHGTNYSSAINICLCGIDLSKSQKYLDFGVGFYTTPSYEHAAITAIRKTKTYNYYNKTSEESYIVEVNCDFSVNKNTLCIKQFPMHSKSWSEFVLNNRLFDDIIEKYKLTNHNRDATYDIVYGEIADGNIINTAYRVNNGLLLPCNVNHDMFLKMVLHMELNILSTQKYSVERQNFFAQKKQINTASALVCGKIK